MTKLMFGSCYCVVKFVSVIEASRLVTIEADDHCKECRQMNKTSVTTITQFAQNCVHSIVWPYNWTMTIFLMQTYSQLCSGID